MIKAVTIIGARPQIIKAAAISRCIKNFYQNEIQEIIVHTGQHYDENMSDIFFREMDIPPFKYNLNVGSSSHASQTAKMLKRIEKILIKENPDVVIIYGDTNSTLAGAVAASKLCIPVAHIEAGLRSFNRKMPEEINRVVADHISTLLFSPTTTGVHNLNNEGIKKENKAPFNIDNAGVFNSGDVMYDNSLFFEEKAKNISTIINDLTLEKNNYILATIHRDNNTDDPKRLNSIFNAIQRISKENKINFVIPLHPRTKKMLPLNIEKNLYNSVFSNTLIKLISPVSFFDMISLETNAFMIFTDSGGVQKEAFFYKKPCIIMRSETEWVEIVEAGAATICDADEKKIIETFNNYKTIKLNAFPSVFGNGNASEEICKQIFHTFGHL